MIQHQTALIGLQGSQLMMRRKPACLGEQHVQLVGAQARGGRLRWLSARALSLDHLRRHRAGD